jgi:hypothetical protein
MEYNQASRNALQLQGTPNLKDIPVMRFKTVRFTTVLDAVV